LRCGRARYGEDDLGTWWVWDARLTSELILLFLYIGYMSLAAAIDDPRRATRLRQSWRWSGWSISRSSIFGAVVEHAAPGRVGEHQPRPSMAAIMLVACW